MPDFKYFNWRSAVQRLKASSCEVLYKHDRSSQILRSSLYILAEFHSYSYYRFAEDEVSFSISTDDPTIMNSKLQDEYQLLYRWGLSEIDVVRAVSENKYVSQIYKKKTQV